MKIWSITLLLINWFIFFIDLRNVSPLSSLKFFFKAVLFITGFSGLLLCRMCFMPASVYNSALSTFFGIANGIWTGILFMVVGTHIVKE